MTVELNERLVGRALERFHNPAFRDAYQRAYEEYGDAYDEERIAGGATVIAIISEPSYEHGDLKNKCLSQEVVDIVLRLSGEAI